MQRSILNAVDELTQHDPSGDILIFMPTERAIREEGCLSLPGQFADVERPARIKIRWRELDGTRREMEAGDLLGVCMQHELDHLDGVLFVDRLSVLKRQFLRRSLDALARGELPEGYPPAGAAKGGLG